HQWKAIDDFGFLYIGGASVYHREVFSSPHYSSGAGLSLRLSTGFVSSCLTLALTGSPFLWAPCVCSLYLHNSADLIKIVPHTGTPLAFPMKGISWYAYFPISLQSRSVVNSLWNLKLGLYLTRGFHFVL